MTIGRPTRGRRLLPRAIAASALVLALGALPPAGVARTGSARDAAPSASTVQSAAVPRANLTPGATVEGADRTQICEQTSVASAQSKPPPEALRRRVLARYRLAGDSTGFKIDRLVPPQLGGSNALSNLWPEPVTGEWNAPAKERLVTRLHDLVCDGRLTLSSAQRQIAHNWIAAYSRYLGRHAVTSPHDLAGWDLVFSDNFDTDVPLGSFPQAVHSKWAAYPAGWHDTSENGRYDPQKTVSIQGGVLNIWLHTENGVHFVAALQPRIPRTSLPWGQRYGRYAIRFRADAIPGYHVESLLWPDSDRWPFDGEIDFPEADLNGTVYAFMHRMGATSGSDQDVFGTAVPLTGWHTAILEWGPARSRFVLDGKLVGTSRLRIPATSMHWVIQTETSLNRLTPPADDVSGNFQIDWVSAWERSEP